MRTDRGEQILADRRIFFPEGRGREEAPVGMELWPAEAGRPSAKNRSLPIGQTDIFLSARDHKNRTCMRLANRGARGAALLLCHWQRGEVRHVSKAELVSSANFERRARNH